MSFGDYHNFQRRVEVLETSVIKPRSVWAEWLFLGEDSPLQHYLRSVNLELNQLVSLNFFTKVRKEPSLELNEVSKINLVNSINYSSENFFKVGEILGYCTFFGLGDLHYENMLSGEIGGRFIFSPIDIECILENFTLPSQTLLIPSYVLKLEHCGMRKYIEKIQREDAIELIPPLLDGYIYSLERLYNLKHEIYNLLEGLGVRDAFTRVIIRSTHLYKKKIESFYEEEKEQLNRGDIPYFFKFLGSDEIYYWTEDQKYSRIKSEIKDDKLVRQLKRFGFSSFSSQKKEMQIIYGAAQIVKLFISQLSRKEKLFGHYINLKEENGKIRLSVMGKEIVC